VIRLLALGLVAVAATLAGSYAAMLWGTAKKSGAEPEEQAILELVKLEPVSVPVIRGGKVDGYVIARVAVSAAASDVKKSKPVLAAYASEAVFRAVYEEEAFDFSALKAVQVSALAERIAKLANERIGRAAIKQSVIESLNFVSRSEVRLQQSR
jgi:hypothetical protein